MSTRWLSTAEFLAVSGVPRRTFFRNKAAYVTRLRGNKLEISAASLPASALNALAPKPAAKQRVPASSPLPVAPLFAELRAPERRRILVDPGQERQALQRLALLQPLLDFCSDAAKRETFRRTLRLQDGSSVTDSNGMARYLAETSAGTANETSASTLWRWKAKYEAEGLAGLARKVREDKGRAKWAEQYPEAAKLAVATYLQPWQTKATAYDALRRELQQLGLTAAELPSYGTVCAYLAALPAAPVVWAREGERAHNERFATYLSRAYTDIVPYQIVVSDHMIHDCEVYNDCFFGVPEGAPMRLQLTMLMDLRSRKALAYSWTPVGSSRSISTALAQMVRTYGVPKVFYCDNGKDYQKVGRGAEAANAGHFRRDESLASMVDDDMTQIERAGVLRRLGIAVQYCIKYHPQSKPVERMFRTLHLGLDAVLPHYTTGSTATRPEAANVAGAQHRKLLRMDRAMVSQHSPLMPASMFIGMARTWLEDDYNAGHRHSGRGMDGRTPNEVFAAGYDAAAHALADPEVLDTLLWQRERRLVRNCAVTVGNRRLVGATPTAERTLYSLSEDEREVIVCFDPNAPQTGVICDADGNKLCDVRAEEFAPHSAAAGPMIATEIAGRRGRRNDMVASVRALRKDVTRSGFKTAAQDLFERANNRDMQPLVLPMAVGDHITQRVVDSRYTPQPQLHSEDIGDSLAARLQQERYGS